MSWFGSDDDETADQTDQTDQTARLPTVGEDEEATTGRGVSVFRRTSDAIGDAFRGIHWGGNDDDNAVLDASGRRVSLADQGRASSMPARLGSNQSDDPVSLQGSAF